MPPTSDEARLIRLSAGGDEECFSALYRRYSARVYTLALRMSGDKYEAEDLTQEVFVLLWRKIGTFKGKSAFSTWLYRLALNLIMRKTAGRRKGRPLSLEADLPDRRVGSIEERLDLQRAIARLPVRCRGVLVLHELMGHSHEEIARIMKISPGTSKAHLSRARKKLKEELTRDE